MLWSALLMMLFPYSLRALSLSPLPCRSVHSGAALYAMPKRGSVVDSYRSVDILCTCRTKLFTYKKKNGTKSNLVKMYVERIVDDPFGILTASEGNELTEDDCVCSNCNQKFGRPGVIKGLPAIKIIGNRVRMK